MNNMTIKITSKPRSKRMVVEMDAERFERLAASLGLFGEDFLKSVDRGESDIRAGRVRQIRSFTDLDL